MSDSISETKGMSHGPKFILTCLKSCDFMKKCYWLEFYLPLQNSITLETSPLLMDIISTCVVGNAEVSAPPLTHQPKVNGDGPQNIVLPSCACGFYQKSTFRNIDLGQINKSFELSKFLYIAKSVKK
jgi:hypothetical protein